MTSNRFQNFRNQINSELQGTTVIVEEGTDFSPVESISLPKSSVTEKLDYTNARVKDSTLDISKPGEYQIEITGITGMETKNPYDVKYNVTVIKKKEKEKKQTAPKNPSKIAPVASDQSHTSFLNLMEDETEKKRPYTFTLTESSREHLNELYVHFKKKSASAFLTELIDNLYEAEINSKK